jgi:hypothetical protein
MKLICGKMKVKDQSNLQRQHPGQHVHTMTALIHGSEDLSPSCPLLKKKYVGVSVLGTLKLGRVMVLSHKNLTLPEDSA